MKPPGQWHFGEAMVVDPAHVAEFASAVGESCREFLSGSACPPTYPIVLAWDVQNRALSGVLPDHALGLHGEQTFKYVGPIRPGTLVFPRSRLESVVPRRTGTTVTAHSELRDHEGVLLCSQLFTLFVVGEALAAVGGAATEVDPVDGMTSRLLGVVEETIAIDQTKRYADASGDRYGIHLDDGFAQSFGLSRAIVHGMCTLAFAARAVRTSLNEHRRGGLTYLAARFSAAVYPGESLRTTVTAHRSEASGALVGGFDTVTGDRQVLEMGRFRSSGSSTIV